MWPFKRRQKTDNVSTTTKTEQYYQGGQRERTGVAWLLAGLTLIVTVLIVLAVFFGGRWLYRKITNKDSSDTSTSQTTSDSGQQTAQESSGSSSSNGSSTSGSSSSSGSSTSQGTVSAPTQTNNPSSVSSHATQTTTPNTGPGDTVAIFALVSVAGYLGYSQYLRRRTTNS